MRYALYNITGSLVTNPLKILAVEARDYEIAFIKIKKELTAGIKAELGLLSSDKIRFTSLEVDLSMGFGENVRYTTCYIESSNGFIIDTFDYAILIM